MTPKVGDTIEMYWNGDARYYMGRITKYNSRTKKHTIVYDDDGKVECLKFAEEKWRARVPFEVFGLIRKCADSWLCKESRRKFGTSMFSAERCLSHALNKLVVAKTDPEYEKEILKLTTPNNEWVSSGNVLNARKDVYDRWEQKMSDSEWAEERKLLASISTKILAGEKAILERQADREDQTD